MDNSAIVKFLKFLGVNLSPEDVTAINGDAPDAEAKPAKEDKKEKPPEMEAPIMNALAKLLKSNAFPAPAGGEAPPAGGAQAAPAPEPATPSNLPLLDKLITDLGGFEAFKALLLKVAESGDEAEAAPAGAMPMQNKKAILVGKILANSKGAMTARDLAGMDVPMLEKVANLQGGDPVDYSAFGGVRQNSATPKLERPSYFFKGA